MTNNTYILQGSDGSTIAFDDVQYTVLRDSLEGLSTYPAEYEISQTPGVVGGRVINTVMGERELSLHVVVWGKGRAELEERRKRLVKALNPLIGPCKLFWNLENGDTYYLVCRPSDDSPAFTVGTAPNAQYWDCTVTLTCADPCWHKDSENVHILISDHVGFHLPFQVPFTFGNASPYITITNNGTAPAPVKIEMHGPLTAPIKLENTTTGKAITIRKNVLADDKLTIDTDRNDLRVTYYDHTTGTETSALSYCTVGSQFWELVPGVNTIFLDIFTVGIGARSTLTYRERQVGL